MTFQELIAMDESGMVAKRYQDFSEWSYLSDLIGTDVSNKSDLGKRRGMIEKEYPKDTHLGARFAWINPAYGKNLENMKGVIKYLVKRRFKDSTERRRVQNFYLKHWVNLNNWTHISKAALKAKTWNKDYRWIRESSFDREITQRNGYSPIDGCDIPQANNIHLRSYGIQFNE